MSAGSLTRRIVSVGESMVEMAPKGDGTFTLGFAGDTFNTAWYLRRALPSDWQIDYMTAIGTDPVSQRMAGFFRNSGIGTAHVARISGRTVGLYLIELTDGERSFAYWRGESAARLLAQDEATLHRAFAGASLIYLSGITLAILPVPDRARLLASLDRARAGALIAFDPNLRPRLWTDPATMRSAITEAARHADIILPSFEDEVTAFGDAAPEVTARRYAALGATLVVVKDGGNPILSCSAEGISSHSPEPAGKVIDTTAAGDSFNAGFLAAHMTGAPLGMAVRAGARLAARVIGAPGALVR